MMPDRECRHCRARLADYAAGRLHDDERRDIEQHLRTCAACGAELDEWEALAEAVRQVSVPVPARNQASAWRVLSARLVRGQADGPDGAAPLSHALHDEASHALMEREHGWQSANFSAVVGGKRRGGRMLPAVAAVLMIAVLAAAIFGWVGHGRQVASVPRLATQAVRAGCAAGKISAQLPPLANISALAMVSPQEGWAVGWTYDSAPSQHATVSLAATGLILHYSHCRWAPVDAPLQHMLLGSLTVLPTGEAWATGMSDETDDYSHSYLLHETGGVWQTVTLPVHVTSAGIITRVRMLSADEGWLVLMTARAVNGQKTDFATLAHDQAGHWTLVTPPYPSVNDLAPVGPNDLWVTGGVNNVDEPSYTAHYRTGKWVSTTVMEQKLRLGSFGEVAPTDGWLSGTIWPSDNSIAHVRTVMLRFDGHTWTPVDVGGDPQAQDVVMFGADDGWAMTAATTTGTIIDPFQMNVGSLQHDVGGSWQTVAWPWPDVTVLPHYGVFERVTAGEYWAVGSDRSGATMGRTVLLHYARGTWSMYGE